MPPEDRFSPVSSMGRTAVVAGTVVALHAAGLWALNSGLGRHELAVTPPEVITAFLATPPVAPPPPAPPAPPVPPPPAPAPPPPKPQPKPKPQPVVKKAPPAPQPIPIADSTPAPNAPIVEAAATDSAPVAAPAPMAPPVPPAPPAPPAPPSVEQPSSNASYLNNPKPAYPSISRRMNEQGKVELRVLISVEGHPQDIEIRQSSGFDRLDRAAVDAVKRWRFVPGKRNGVPEAMWHVVPINFVLD